jgi:hypothetical protein
VITGTYHALIKVSAQPWTTLQTATNSLSAPFPVKLIPAQLKSGTISVKYDTGTITGSYYAFQNGVNVDNNIMVRSLLAATPAFNDDDIGLLIESIFTDNGLGLLTSTSKWSEVTKSSVLNYFKSKPYGWTNKSADYYLNHADLFLK